MYITYNFLIMLCMVWVSASLGLVVVVVELSALSGNLYEHAWCIYWRHCPLSCSW